MKKILNFVVVLLVVILFVGVVFSLYKMIPSGGGIVDTSIDPDTGTTGVDVEEIIINMKNYIF